MASITVYNPPALRISGGYGNRLYCIGGLLWVIFIANSLTSCVTTKSAFDPGKRYRLQQVQQDYDLFRKILEERHPGLYWYTPRPVMDNAFETGRRQLKDSLTETDFRKILSGVLAYIKCGHTTVKASKGYSKYTDTVQNKRAFPFSIKTWGDTSVLVSTIYRNAPVSRGDRIIAINGRSIRDLLDTMYLYISADGGNLVAKNQLLSTGSYFGTLYSTLFGWPQQFSIAYTDSTGNSYQSVFRPVPVKKDTMANAAKGVLRQKEKVSRSAQLKKERSLEIVTSENYALMQLNSFSQKLKLKKFFRQSFRKLKTTGTQNLIIDLRINGGGRVSNSTALLKYLADKKYKTGDSLYAISSKSKYSRYIKNDFWNKLFIRSVTKNIDGKRHYRYYEQHFFSPGKQHHYTGRVYLLTGGLTYSASVLVLNALQHQQNITIVGEPSGGAAYGDNAWLIPDVTLPNTKVRFRLPLFRFVANKDLLQNGTGVIPDIYAGPTDEAIRRGQDYKLSKAVECIRDSLKKQP
ncbi:MAG: S41 family peptidase [Niabella sp.]